MSIATKLNQGMSGAVDLSPLKLAKISTTPVTAGESVEGFFGSGFSPSSVKQSLSSADGGRIADGLKVFDRLLTAQPLVKIPTDLRAGGAASARWMLQGDSEEIVYATASMIDNLGGIQTIVREMVKGLVTGVHGFEIVWKKSIYDGLKWDISLIEIPPSMWAWSRTDGLYIESSSGRKIPVTLGKFLVSHLGHNGVNPIVNAPMRSAAGYLVTAYYTFLTYVAYIERFAAPLTIGTYPEDTPPDAQEVSEFMAAVNDLGATGSLTMPSNFDVKFAQHYVGPNESPPREMLRMVSDAISRLIIGGTLSTDSQSKAGSYGASSVHAAVRHEIRERDCAEVARIIQRQLIAPFVFFNFGDTAKVPELTPVVQSSIDETYAKVYSSLSKDLGFSFDPVEVCEDLGIPSRTLATQTVTKT